eukprot:IDg7948t1
MPRYSYVQSTQPSPEKLNTRIISTIAISTPGKQELILLPDSVISPSRAIEVLLSERPRPVNSRNCVQADPTCFERTSSALFTDVRKLGFYSIFSCVEDKRLPIRIAAFLRGCTDRGTSSSPLLEISNVTQGYVYLSVVVITGLVILGRLQSRSSAHQRSSRLLHNTAASVKALLASK